MFKVWLHQVKTKLAKLSLIFLTLGLIYGCSGDSEDQSLKDASDELAFKDSSSTTNTTKKAATTIAPSTTVKVDPANPSSGQPVTTRSVGLGSTAIYQGILGRLLKDQLITPPVVPAPIAKPGTFPLTGMVGDSPARTAAVVKIDNGPGARPQTGLDIADIVYEEGVESGVTRFAAVFHSQGAIVGPVRSGRTTDISILSSYVNPMYLYSGANTVTDSLLRSIIGVQNRSFDTSSGYWRDRSRRAPTNVYTDLGPHWASAKGSTPPAHFSYRGLDDKVGGVVDNSISVKYFANPVLWDWDGTKYLRTQGGSAHKVANGTQIAAQNVVVVETREVATGMTDVTRATVPEYVFVGNGKATVFTAGKKVEGIWTKSTLAHAATLTTEDNKVIKLTPGNTWVEIIAEDSGMLR